MDIRGFVYGLVDHVPGFLRTPARYIADRVFGVWDDVSLVFRLARPSWLHLSGNLWDCIRTALYAIGEAAATLNWLVTVKIPAMVNHAADNITRWVSGQLNLLRTFATGIVNAAVDNFMRNLNALLNLLTVTRQWVTDRLSEVWRTLTTVAQLVASLLTDPGRLATWLVAAMFSALLRYFGAHVDAIAEYLWARRQRVIVDSVARIEALLARIL